MVRYNNALNHFKPGDRVRVSAYGASSYHFGEVVDVTVDKVVWVCPSGCRESSLDSDILSVAKVE